MVSRSVSELFKCIMHANLHEDMLTFKAQDVQGLLHLNHDKLTASPIDSIPPRNRCYFVQDF